jgi:hypothetical protein
MSNLPPVDFSSALDWERPQASKGSSLLSHDGEYACTVAAAEPGQSKSSANYQIVFTLIVDDEDNKGAKLYSYIPYTGMANTEPPRPNVHRLFEVLDSSGTTRDQMEKLAGVGKLDIAQVCETLKGRTVYITARSDKYEKTGNWSSKVAYFTNKQRYMDNRAINAHRTALPPEAAAWRAARTGTPVAVSSSNGASAAAVPAPTAAASQSATDLL